MLLTVPAAVALAVVPTEIVTGLFERGAFTAADTPATAYALAIFALGLPSFVMIKVFSPAYFAREDTATPMRYAAISLTANTLGSIGAVLPVPRDGADAAPGHRRGDHARRLAQRRPALSHAGQARAVRRPTRGCGAPCRASCLPAVVMGVALWIAADALEPWFAPRAALLSRLGALAALVGAGLLVYAIAILALGVLDLRQLRGLLRRDRPPAGLTGRAGDRRHLPLRAPRAITRADHPRTSDAAPAKANSARLLRHAADGQPASGQLSGRHGALGRDAEEPRVHLLRGRHARHHHVAGPQGAEGRRSAR